VYTFQPWNGNIGSWDSWKGAFEVLKNNFFAYEDGHQDNKDAISKATKNFNKHQKTYKVIRKEKLENGFAFGEKAKEERRRKIDKEALKQAVELHPDAFLWELAEQFKCTPVAIHYALGNMGITRKKNNLSIMKDPMRKDRNLAKKSKESQKKNVFILMKAE
jgi:transposase